MNSAAYLERDLIQQLHDASENRLSVGTLAPMMPYKGHQLTVNAVLNQGSSEIVYTTFGPRERLVR